MSKKFWLNVLGLMLFFMSAVLAGDIHPVAAESNLKLDFGEITPFDVTIVERTLPVAVVKEKINKIIVEFDPALSDPSGLTIPMRRLKMAVNDQLYALKDYASPIDLTAVSPDSGLYHFMFSLELTPADLPGLYEGKVLIKYQTGAVWNSINACLSVEIEPWVRIEANQKQINLDQISADNTKLQNAIPFNIKVASNSSWILYMEKVQSEETGREIPLAVKVIPRKMESHSAQGIQNLALSETILSKEKMALGAGNATVINGLYWAEIDLALFLRDFINCPAGNQILLLQFTVGLWDNRRN